MDSVNPFDVLREEMENEEVALRVNAIHRLKIVASLMPADKIKSQLIPYFDQLIKREEDEVLFALAEELGNLATQIPNISMSLLAQLETLAGFDETVVRDQAVKSIITVCGLVSDQEIIGQFVPMLFRLANNETNFTCRVSAVNLMCALYPRSGAQKEKIRQKFTELCNEETPMVRRVVAMKLGEMAQLMDKVHVINDLIPIQKQLCQDEQDQVRLLSMESLKCIAKTLSGSENKTNTLPIIIQSAEDKSWRVRLALSKIFAELAEAMGKDISDSSLINIFSNLLKDNEPDVKVQAVHSLAKFITQVSPEKLQVIIPQLQQLSRDSSSHVKNAVTQVYGGIASLLPKDYVQQKLGSYLLEMLNDENFEVRKGAFVALAKYLEAVGIEALSMYAPALKSGMEDPKWRVRQQVLNTIAKIAVTFKSADAYQKYLDPIFSMYLKDRAYEIRQFGNARLTELLQIFKPEWFVQTQFARIVENLQKDAGSTFRMNALYALNSAAQALPADIIQDKIVPLVLKACKDPVPNVRFVAIKVAKAISKRVDSQSILQQIKQVFSELQDDPDRDVKFFASEALQY